MLEKSNSYYVCDIYIITACNFLISSKNVGYDTSTDSAPVTVDLSVSIDAIVNAMNSL